MLPKTVSEGRAVRRYDIAGSIVARLDPLNRKIAISYTDNFNSAGNPVTYAYPTTLSDPANNSSTVRYRYDIGANIRAQSPAPAGNSQGKITERLFDSIGRSLKETIVNSGAYTRYEYPASGIQSKVYSTIIDTNNNGADTADEVLTESWADGAGRVRMSRAPHTFDSSGNTLSWSGSLLEYDVLGQVKRQSVPTEMNSNWQPAGDDYRLDAQGNVTFLWTYQKYDWKSRVVRKINTDGIDQTTLNDSDEIITYEGCGCAGGQVTTIQGENIVETDWYGNNSVTLGRRTKKIYEDTLGRAWKTEILNWNASVYSTSAVQFNGRDEATSVTQTEQSTSAGQLTTMTYDGHGRLRTRRPPTLCVISEDFEPDCGRSSNENIDPRRNPLDR